MSYAITELSVDHRINPLGIDSVRPVFEWKLKSDRYRVRQETYRIEVFLGQTLVWDTGKVTSDQTSSIIYSGDELTSLSEYIWTATSWNNLGESAQGSGRFETAFLDKQDWKAKWVEPRQSPAFHEPALKRDEIGHCEVNIEDIRMQPAQMIRREFEVPKANRKARAYVTAHGIYSIELNGERIGDIELPPGHTTYHEYLEYQTYDITHHLKAGLNAIGMYIADGWYCGKVGFMGHSCQYGDTLAGLFQLEIFYEDGTRDTVCSDEMCRSSVGPIDYADLFVGECYDARKEQSGFSSTGFSGEGWENVQIKNYGYDSLRAQFGDPVRICEVIRPKEIFVSPKGEVILDAGQVLAGRVRMRVQGPKGTKITLEHTETLDEHGNFLCNIIGKFVKQTDTYILNGAGPEVFDPTFTYHGFRYVRITGYPGKPTTDDFDILVIHSDLKVTGLFTCSDSRLNQLQHNIFWSQRSNMISIPTDCPQREKAGFTGDAQIFAPTACFNMDMAAFFRRWLRNMRINQLDDGQIPIIVPYLKAYHPNGALFLDTHCSAGWGDAAVILPWAMYCTYGDRTVLSENYAMMKKWVEYIRHTAETEMPEGLKDHVTPERQSWQKYLWNTHMHFGDWLTPSVSINEATGDIDMRQSALRTMDIVPTCFYAYSTELMTKIAKILELNKDEKYYYELNRNIQRAFAQEYIDEHGYLKTELQGIYVLALQMKLIPQAFQRQAVEKLVQMIRDNGNRLDTGFLSIPFLLDVLEKNGKRDIAYDLLYQEKCPSWLYEVKMGATTIWEAWQAILPNGTPTSVSYNHYAFGCVGDWMYRSIGGVIALEPGYKKIQIRPGIESGMRSATVVFQSIHGEISNEWHIEKGKVGLAIRIPVNVEAQIILPHAKSNIGINGVALERYPLIKSFIINGNNVLIWLGSGDYMITYEVEVC